MLLSGIFLIRGIRRLVQNIEKRSSVGSPSFPIDHKTGLRCSHIFQIVADSPSLSIRESSISAARLRTLSSTSSCDCEACMTRKHTNETIKIYQIFILMEGVILLSLLSGCVLTARLAGASFKFGEL